MNPTTPHARTVTILRLAYRLGGYGAHAVEWARVEAWSCVANATIVTYEMRYISAGAGQRIVFGDIPTFRRMGADYCIPGITNMDADEAIRAAWEVVTGENVEQQAAK
jgi:hypothetical protein